MPKESKAVQTTEAAGQALVPAYGNKYTAENTGWDNASNDDVLIGMVNIVQQQSPEINAEESQFLEGAKVGDLFNSATRELYGDTVEFVPCGTRKMFVEWVPQDAGGGFVGTYTPDDPMVIEAIEANNGSTIGLRAQSGNDLIETYYMVGYLLADDAPSPPVIIPCTSTKIKPYKALMTRLRTVKGEPPLFAFRVKVATVTQRNKSDKPFKNFVFTAPVENNVVRSMIPPDREDLLDYGQNIARAFGEGEISVDRPPQLEGAAKGVDESDVPI
jgi:hypothetical protein